MSKPYRTFKCHKCKGRRTKVTSVDHRSEHVDRYRICLDCGTKFKTEERYVKYQFESESLGNPTKTHNNHRGWNSVKLTAKKVREIRNSKLSIFELSIEYNVDISTIKAVRANRTWKHIT